MTDDESNTPSSEMTDDESRHLAVDLATGMIEDLAEENLRLTNRLYRLINQNGELCEEIDRLKAQVMELSWAATVVALGKERAQ